MYDSAPDERTEMGTPKVTELRKQGPKTAPARAWNIAEALDRMPGATDEDREEAAYLRDAFVTDCMRGGPIGPDSAHAYLDCAMLRLDRKP